MHCENVRRTCNVELVCCSVVLELRVHYTPFKGSPA